MITLRKYTLDDATVIHKELGCNPVMMRYTGWNPYHSMESTEGFIRQILQGYEDGTDEYSWIIEAEEKPVGIIGAYDYDEAENSIEIGYSIFESCWGQGYASMAVEKVCEILLVQDEIITLKAWSASENIGSKRVLEKAGFVQTGTSEAAINVDGESFDQLFYEKRS